MIYHARAVMISDDVPNKFESARLSTQQDYDLCVMVLDDDNRVIAIYCRGTRYEPTHDASERDEGGG